MTPIRVVCNNTLNLALSTAKRSWAMVHTGNIKEKIHEAQETLFMAETYMGKLGKEIEELKRQRITERQVKEYIEILLPLEKTTSLTAAKNVKKLRDDLRARYYDAPDLQDVGGNNAYRFINAVSDFATHNEPLRRTANYKENLFMRTMDGNPMIDRAYQIVKTA